MPTSVQTRPVVRLERPTTLQLVGLIVGALAFFLPFFIPIPGLSPEAQRMLSIFLLAIVFWVTEAIPLVATAGLVILLEVLTVSSTGLFPVGEGALGAKAYFAALADPVIILFLGGFLLADGAAKFGLDKNLAAVMLKPFQGSGRMTVLGLMSITAVLSMFMSNTATTATMFAVVIPILAVMTDAKARAGIALSIPVAANIGGMGTPVGTPPNAIALGALAANGIQISFLKWMMLAVPLMLVVLAIGWFVLVTFFIPKGTNIELALRSDFDRSAAARIYYVVAGLTVALWMTEPLHGINSNVVGFIPVAVLLATQVMTGDDLKMLQWPVLWLVSGGIALGVGVGATGLDKWLLGSVNWTAMSVTALVVVLAGLGLGMSNVISHSAAANLLIPLALGLGTSISLDIVQVGVIIALACSLGMSLPISTPPNAIAYATGEVSTKYMALVGVIVGVAGAVLLAFVMPWFWTTLGVL
ncbi:transporter [Bowdeniella nasicola]|uniref:Transporter n=1 Tax=Bowdeniella nasicola TaxID=208480 RepID=A0A1Q5Q616_9ACTO|nr:DASS family sodium-coupled anion symporter [Bowdeniella nasicola]OKL55152.1 transporter [Bowdeniella nasicola]